MIEYMKGVSWYSKSLFPDMYIYDYKVLFSVKGKLHVNNMP